MLGPRGLAGDQVTDTEHHGSPDQSVCCHMSQYYDLWNAEFGLLSSPNALAPGSVGENWTLIGADENSICIGDIYTVGEATVQVSAPRFPCSKQERKVGIQGFLKRTKETLRTGFYLRTLTPGSVEADNEWLLTKRPHPDLTLRIVDATTHHKLDRTLVERLLENAELAEGLKIIFKSNTSRSGTN